MQQVDSRSDDNTKNTSSFIIHTQGPCDNQNPFRRKSKQKKSRVTHQEMKTPIPILNLIRQHNPLPSSRAAIMHAQISTQLWPVLGHFQSDVRGG